MSREESRGAIFRYALDMPKLVIKAQQRGSKAPRPNAGPNVRFYWLQGGAPVWPETVRGLHCSGGKSEEPSQRVHGFAG
jgi:hypothetical protein